eukprot:3472626-Prymnesium_polylepis.1
MHRAARAQAVALRGVARARALGHVCHLLCCSARQAQAPTSRGQPARTGTTPWSRPSPRESERSGPLLGFYLAEGSGHQVSSAKQPPPRQPPTLAGTCHFQHHYGRWPMLSPKA